MKYRLKKELPGMPVGTETWAPIRFKEGTREPKYYTIVDDCARLLIAIPAAEKDQWLEPVGWKPEGQEYWYIDEFGKIEDDFWDDMASDDLRYEFGNCFPTREAAEKARDAIRETLKNLSEGV